jgi:hypothetical protein
MEVRKDSREMSVVKGGGEKKSRREMSEGMKRKRGGRVTRRRRQNGFGMMTRSLHRLVRQTYHIDKVPPWSSGTARDPSQSAINSLAQNKSERGFLKAQ